MVLVFVISHLTAESLQPCQHSKHITLVFKCRLVVLETEVMVSSALDFVFWKTWSCLRRAFLWSLGTFNWDNEYHGHEKRPFFQGHGLESRGLSLGLGFGRQGFGLGPGRQGLGVVLRVKISVLVLWAKVWVLVLVLVVKVLVLETKVLTTSLV